METPPTGMADSPFEKLSPELRNRIYDFAIAEEKTLRGLDTDYAFNEVTPSITRVCRQMRDENLLMSFSGLTYFRVMPVVLAFTFDDLLYEIEQFNRWFAAFPDKSHAVIRGFEFQFKIDSASFREEWYIGKAKAKPLFARFLKGFKDCGYADNQIVFKLSDESFGVNDDDDDVPGDGYWILRKRWIEKVFRDVGINVTVKAASAAYSY